MTKKTVTIDEIAKKANVSKTTVSRYLNGKYEYMSSETRSRIQNVIATEEYRPSSIARNMKLARTMTIGCVVVDISNPVTSAIVQGILSAAEYMGYSVLFSSTGGDPEKERSAIETFCQSRVDGLLLNSSGNNFEYFQEIQNMGTKIVLVDRIPEGTGTFSGVRSQNAKATHDCLLHLYEEGYRSIALFEGQNSKGNTNIETRKRAFVETMRECFGMDGEKMIFPIEETNFRHLYETDTPQLGKAQEDVEAFLRQAGGPKAIFAVSATTALSTLWALQSLKEDNFPQLGFCSFNDWGTASIVKNGITTITQDAYSIGYESVQKLVDAINDPNSVKQVIEVPNRLIIRHSTMLGSK